MQLPTFAERVLMNRERFTEFEETFALYVQANPSEAATQTVAMLAQSFHIAPNAIVRFAHKLGYAGFSDMRISISHELEMNTATSQQSNDPRSHVRAHVERTLDLCCGSNVLERASRRMDAAKSILIFAVGETAYIAQAFARRISEFDGKTQFYTYENQVRRELDRANSPLLMLISLSGQTPQVLGLARHALAKNIEIISLTHLAPSPLSQLSSISLHCSSPQRFIGNANLTDLTPLLAALSTLELTYLQHIGAFTTVFDD